MPILDNLDEFYSYADAHAHELSHLASLGDYAQKIRDRSHRDVTAHDATLSQIEINALSFDLRGGDLASMFTFQHGEYPDPNAFDDEHRSYLNRRLQSAKSATLIARYSHVLWKAGERRIDHARRAIDSYLESVELHVQQDTRCPEDHFGILISQEVIAACRIALSIGDSTRVHKCQRKLIDLVTNFNHESSSRYNLVFNLTEFAAKQRKKIPGAIDDLARVVEREYESNHANADYHGAIQLAKLAQRLPGVKGEKTNEWHLRIGDCYESLAKQENDPNNPVAPHFYAESIEHYRLGGASEDTVQRLTQEHERSARQIQYGRISMDVDLSDQIARSERFANELINKGEEFVVEFVMMAKGIIPSRQEIEDHVSTDSERHPLLAHIPVTVTDDLGHQTQRFSEPDEREYAALLRVYPWWLTTRTTLIVREVLFEAVKRKALSIEGISKLLQRRSWVGVERSSVNSGCDGGPPISWLELVMPGIEHYFNQVQRTTSDHSIQPDYVLTVDSLVPKIEGMVRDLCRLSGGVAVNMTRDKRGRTVQREKDLHSLLYEETILDLLDEDDLLFYRFLFVEQGGYNLRNRVAHGLTNQRDYTLERALLVLVALLRLSRYEVRERTSTDEKAV